MNIYIFLNTYLVIVSAINTCGSHKRGRPTWALVDSQRHVFTENARAFSHARDDPVTVACISYYDCISYFGDSHAIRPTSLATGESVFLPLGTGRPPENFEKIGVV